MELFYWIIGGIVLLFILLFILTYFQTKNSSIKLNEEDFKKVMRKGQLIDVRTKQEYDAGHINGARNITIQAIIRNFHQLRKDQPIYLYCANGRRSARAALFLRSRGYEEIYELEKGLKGWSGPLK